MADERETISQRLRSTYIVLSSSEFHACITGIWKEHYLRMVLRIRRLFPPNAASCRSAETQLYSQAKKLFPKAVTWISNTSLTQFIDPASRVSFDLEKSEEDWRRLCSQDTTSNFLKQRLFWGKWQVKEDNDYSINKAFIHSFDYILFSQCSLCSCFFFFAMFMAGEGERSSICSKNEIITMNKYCFHKRRYSLYIEVFSCTGGDWGCNCSCI